VKRLGKLVFAFCMPIHQCWLWNLGSYN